MPLVSATARSFHLIDESRVHARPSKTSSASIIDQARPALGNSLMQDRKQALFHYFEIQVETKEDEFIDFGLDGLLSHYKLYHLCHAKGLGTLFSV